MDLAKETSKLYPVEKVRLHLLKGIENESYQDFNSRILEDTVPKLLSSGCRSLRVTITAEKPPRALFPFNKARAAMVTVFGPAQPLRYSNLSASAEAEQSVPLAPRDIPAPLVHTDGVCMLTLFNKKPSISYPVFFDRWFYRHTPYSLRHFPLTGYVRNAKTAGPESDPQFSDAAVEEFFRTSDDLVRPSRFFGTKTGVAAHLVRLYFDVRSFINMRTIETYYCRSYSITNPDS